MKYAKAASLVILVLFIGFIVFILYFYSSINSGEMFSATVSSYNYSLQFTKPYIDGLKTPLFPCPTLDFLEGQTYCYKTYGKEELLYQGTYTISDSLFILYDPPTQIKSNYLKLHVIRAAGDLSIAYLYPADSKGNITDNRPAFQSTQAPQYLAMFGVGK